MKIKLLIGCAFALGSFSANAQNHCEPTECESNGYWKKASTQMTNFVNVVKTTDPSNPETQGIEKPQTPATVTASSNATTNDIIKIRVFKNGGGKATVSWGDGTIQEINMDADTKGDVAKNASNFKGIEVTHTSSVGNPTIEIWADGVEGLYLSNSKITTVDLSKLTNLKKLVLDKNHELASVDLSTLTQLQKLDLSNTKALQSVTFASSMT